MFVKQRWKQGKIDGYSGGCLREVYESGQNIWAITSGPLICCSRVHIECWYSKHWHNSSFLWYSRLRLVRMTRMIVSEAQFICITQASLPALERPKSPDYSIKSLVSHRTHWKPGFYWRITSLARCSCFYVCSARIRSKSFDVSLESFTLHLPQNIKEWWQSKEGFWWLYPSI